ncbi:enhanced adult sensory threshold isoform X3 [Arctopsyche grandis]|uniref:enhanced adult sensory threshold isoform X3 n=1 Tax=Arctopsyche grandis TaxID=121162 RepID=UPI00406DA423
MATRDKKPKGGTMPPPTPAAPESESEPRPKSRLAAAPHAKTKSNFKLNMIATQGARRRGRPAKRTTAAATGGAASGPPGRGRPRDPPPDTKPSLARLVKRKQLMASAALTKKKALLAKDVIKKAEAKIAKKSEAKPAEVDEALQIKKEPESESASVPDSRCSSPRTRKPRTSSDLLIAMTSQSDVALTGAKSPYSTRSERSNSPFGQTPTQKLLRNGKQRSLKNTLLSEAVELEKKKRNRLMSESLDAKTGEATDCDEDRKNKRFRSFSREGSEISKCSDVTESDLSFCDNVDAEIKKESKDVTMTESAQTDDTFDEIKVGVDGNEKSSALAVGDLVDSNQVDDKDEASKLSDTNSLDSENNNKSKNVEAMESVPEGLDDSVASGTEKIVEKSLILDNMSKTFNEASASDSIKSIRRSARQRKITVKAKEHEEAILAESALDMNIKFVMKLSKLETSENTSTEDIDVSDSDKTSNRVIKTDIDQPSPPKVPKVLDKVGNSNKIAEKKLVNSESSNLKNELSIEALPKTEDSKTEEVPVKIDDTSKLVSAESDLTEKIDDSLKENIQSSYANKSYPQDFGKLIDRLKNFEEQDEKKRQEKMSKLGNADKRPVMVTNDVVLIPKSNLETKSLKDLPNSISIEKVKEKDNILNCFDINSSVTIVKKEQTRKSFDIDLPSSVTLIKRSSNTSRKHSTGSNSRDGDSVTMIDKSLGKEITLDIRKSIDKGILTIEPAKSPQLPPTGLQVLPVPPKMQKISTVAKPPTTVLQILPINTDNSDGNADSAIVHHLPAAITVEIKESPVQPVAPPVVPTPTPPPPPPAKPPVINDPVEKPSTPPPPISSFVESPEKQKQKEEILGTLGLLTLKAANQAKLDKQKQKELIKSNKTPISNDTYTGTLKTVIKLNRNNSDKKKARSPLKMTFHKNKSRGNKLASDSADSDSDDGPTYTIHKEFGISSGSGTGSSDNHLTSGGHRKTHYSNRFNNHVEAGLQDSVIDPAADLSANKEIAANLVIPEKASSFAIHPDRLCQDQCFYCGGKFGIYDTPCHIAQIKSVERQKKILDSEEKLTVDSCLCDACYRHVDRRANCPSYRKRPVPMSLTAPMSGPGDICYSTSCCHPASHTLRRKWLVKMRHHASKVVQLDLDYPGLHTIPLCDVHYQAILQLMICGLCKRRLSRNHVHFINQEYQALNPLLKNQGFPVYFEDRPIVCKLCRYFCTLLLRPPKSHQINKHAFVKSHRRRLMQAHNLEFSEESDTDYTDEPSLASDANQDQNDISKEKKKGKNGKSKSKKNNDASKLSDENDVLNQNIHNKKAGQNAASNKVHMEDIESLISSNKILVPNLGSGKTNQSDTSGIPVLEVGDAHMIDFDNPLIAMDKSSELQCLLQKCNATNTTIHRNSVANSTQKPKNILKVHNAPAINKSSQSQRKMNKNLKRIQKLGQVITQKDEFEETYNKLPNREEFTIEPTCTLSIDDKIISRDITGHNIFRNINLNDECTIETIPPKLSKNSLDINSMKNKWQMTESFSQVKKNLNALSKNFSNEQSKKRVVNQNDHQFSNPVRRLETNPSISVRELFPGEEEMNLQCSIEFGNLKGVTPEGWEKCNSIIQYDTSTKNLWQELQKPYGNQSSFLRHLILLEKYFRNGDLILSQNANFNAITYSESVQNRLRAYDNIPTNNGDPSAINILAKSTQVPNTQPETVESAKKADSSNEFRKPIMSIGAGKSLLKSNQISNPDTGKNKATGNANKSDNSPVPNQLKVPKSTPLNQANDQSTIAPKPSKGMPVSLTNLEKLGNQLIPSQVPAIPRPPTPRPDKTANDCLRTSLPPPFSIEAKTSTPKSDSTVVKPKPPSLPPELIAINPQTVLQRKSIENVLKNIQQLSKSSPVVPATAIPVPAVQPATNATISTVTNSQPKTSKSNILNSKDHSKKGKSTSKQWRPTLIPITDESKSRNCQDVLHQTADGRRLPSLVQVTQGGKPYHITIQDYNRMCILRREKLQQNQKAEMLKSQSPFTSNATDTAADSITVSTAITKSPSPTPTNADAEKNLITVQSSNTKSAETSVLSVPIKSNLGKSDESDDKITLPEVDTSSLLKNVVLKNVTIAPITTTSTGDSRSSVYLNTPQSLLTSSVKSVLQVPQIIGSLSSLESVAPETINSDINAITALVPKVVPITSQAIIMPKIPKSLTVIPQTVTHVSNSTSPQSSSTQGNSPLSVLPIPATPTPVSSSITVSPPEP